jgi:hypothetical protein
MPPLLAWPLAAVGVIGIVGRIIGVEVGAGITIIIAVGSDWAIYAGYKPQTINPIIAQRKVANNIELDTIHQLNLLIIRRFI